MLAVSFIIYPQHVHKSAPRVSLFECNASPENTTSPRPRSARRRRRARPGPSRPGGSSVALHDVATAAAALRNPLESVHASAHHGAPESSRVRACKCSSRRVGSSRVGSLSEVCLSLSLSRPRLLLMEGARRAPCLKEDKWTSQLALGRARRAPCLKERKLELHCPDVPALESAPAQVDASVAIIAISALACNHIQSVAIRWHAIRC